MSEKENPQSNAHLLAYRVDGKGPPVVLLHEFAGSMEAWDEQVWELMREYRTVVYNARGYPPSWEPASWTDYSQANAVEDLRRVLDQLGINRAALVGLSMGGTTALHFAIRHPDRVAGLVIAASGSGSDDPKAFTAEFGALAEFIEAEGPVNFAERYLSGPTRLPLKEKRPSVWLDLRQRLGTTPASTLVGTIKGVMLRRPPIYDLELELRRLSVPVLVMIGDLDRPVVRAAGFLTACMRFSRLVVFRDTGHTLNLEEPTDFNAAVLRFLAEIGRERWD
jgi:pimeloyl-ACP methyl ester carboxylesterase